jgi:hypothetical protein
MRCSVARAAFNGSLRTASGASSAREVGLVEGVRQRRGLCLGGSVVNVFVKLIFSPANHTAVHGDGSAQATAVLKVEQQLMFGRDGSGSGVQTQFTPSLKSSVQFESEISTNIPNPRAELTHAQFSLAG